MTRFTPYWTSTSRTNYLFCFFCVSKNYESICSVGGEPNHVRINYFSSTYPLWGRSSAALIKSYHSTQVKSVEHGVNRDRSYFLVIEARWHGPGRHSSFIFLLKRVEHQNGTKRQRVAVWVRFGFQLSADTVTDYNLHHGNQYLCLPEAELNTKTNPNGHLWLFGFVLVSNSVH